MKTKLIETLVIILFLMIFSVLNNEYALDEDMDFEISDQENRNINSNNRNNDLNNNNQKNIPANEEFEFSNEQEYLEYETQRLNKNNKKINNSKSTQTYDKHHHGQGHSHPNMSKMTNKMNPNQDTIIDPNQALNPNSENENKEKNLFFIEKIFTPEILLALELISFIVFFLFCLNYFFGKMQNYNILESWNKNTKDFFVDNYAHVGFSKETQYDLPFL